MTTTDQKINLSAEENEVGSNAIHLEAKFPVAPEHVYELLTNGAKFGEVTGQPGKGGGSTGAYFSLFDGWLQGRQVELVPNELIAQAWRFMDWDPGIYSMVRFKLLPEGNGTRLILDQDGVPPAFREHVKSNWDGFYFAPFRKFFQQLLRESSPD
jgi:activator of HSP90 ATPase